MKGVQHSAWTHLARAVGLGVSLYLVTAGLMVVVLGWKGLWYGFFDLSDTGVYFRYAQAMHRGLRPYADFPVEYPPLALPLFALPGASGGLLAYRRLFAAVMLAAGLLAAAATAGAAARAWPTGRRAFVAAAAFPAGVACLGAIVANRYDVTVALVLAVLLLLLVDRRWVAAGAILGVGFALKLTPVILLPLVLLLAPPGRTRVLAALAFTGTGLLPFAALLPGAARGFAYLLAYHARRPLQVESVLASPLLVGRLLGVVPVEVGDAFGSQFIDAPGAGWLAASSGPLTAAALVMTYSLVLRRRKELVAAPERVALPVTAALLAFMAFAKVLSPQFLVWLLPSSAFLLPVHPVLGTLLLSAMLLTQVEFPAQYWAFVALAPGPVAWVVARNALVLGAFALSSWMLWRIPPGDPGARGSGTGPRVG